MKKISFSRFFTAITILSMAALFSGCEEFVEFRDVILITGTDTDNVLQFVVEDEPSGYSLTASATDKVMEDIKVHFQINTSLVEDFNRQRSTGFYPAPSNSIELSANSAVIRAGSSVSEPVMVYVTSTEEFVDGRSYMIPVSITQVDGNLDVLEASRTAFLRISRIMQFTSIDISNWNFYHEYYFEEDYVLESGYTFEIKAKINSWHPGSEPISRLCNFGPIAGGAPNLLRFGEHGSDINQLQWVAPAGAAFTDTRFALDRWYTITTTWDGFNYRLYVDGVLDISFEGTPGAAHRFGMIELGMSWDVYPFRQRFLGNIAEIRLWEKPRSGGEIRSTLCAVDPQSEGLVAYWKLNEGEGDTFYDSTGNGYDMHWPNSHHVWDFSDDNVCAQ